VRFSKALKLPAKDVLILSRFEQATGVAAQNERMTRSPRGASAAYSNRLVRRSGSLLLSLLSLFSAAALPSVLELDGDSFRTLLQAERERDVVLLLHEGAGTAAAVADEAARELRLTASSSIVLATLDTALHGFPAGLHVHHALPAAVLLPALEGRERVYAHWEDFDDAAEGAREREHLPDHEHAHAHAHDHSHDGESCSGDAHAHAHGHSHDGETCSGDAHAHAHAHEHAHHGHSHEAEPPLTAAGLLRFLRAHSTFRAEVPAAPRTSSRWAGRTEELWRAVGGGLEALREQMEQLRSERDAARAALAACACAGGAGGT
jgi:hypothetical protein